MKKKLKPTQLTKTEREEINKRIAKHKKGDSKSYSWPAAKEKILRDYYGKLKNTFGDALQYQKNIRDEW
jgi:hypothetical protein